MKLSEFDKQHRGFRKTLADDLGVSETTIGRYIHLDREPSILVIARIHELTGGLVGFVDWVLQAREKNRCEGKK